MSHADLIINLTDRRSTGLADSDWTLALRQLQSLLAQLSVEADRQEHGTMFLVTAARL